MKLKARVREFTGSTRNSVSAELSDRTVPAQELPPAAWVELVREGDNYFLYRYATTGAFAGDTWHQSLEEGKAQASKEFRIESTDWRLMTDTWDYATIAKGPNPNGVIQGVPDTGARPEESRPEWAFRMFLKCLQTIAADTDTLIRAYDPRVHAIDELVNDLSHYLEASQTLIQEGVVSSDCFAKARILDQKIDEMSGRQDASLWTPDALRCRGEWAEVRQLAKDTLTDLGYTLEPPPPQSM